MSSRRITLTAMVASVLALGSCEIADYPYYLRIDDVSDLKPVFFTIVDTSGSMSGYLTMITELVAESAPFFLSRLYDGDQDAMDLRYCVVPWPAGETWVDALTLPPSALLESAYALGGPISLMPGFPEHGTSEFDALAAELDAHTSRFYLFYGNGAGQASSDGRDTYAEMLSTYRREQYRDLEFARAILVHASGDDTLYSAWADCVISGEGYDVGDETIGGLFPSMGTYGWSYRQFAPGEQTTEEYVTSIINSALGVPDDRR